MVRAHRAPDRVLIGWRLLAPLLTASLILTASATGAPVVEAGGASGSAALRQQQLRAEATMIRADKQIKKLQKQRRHRSGRVRKTKRVLDRAITRRDHVRKRARRLGSRSADAQAILGRSLRVRPNPSGVQVADKPALRKRVRKLNTRQNRVQHKVRVAARKVDRARDRKQKSTRTVSRARVKARVAARERAEDRLSSSITRLLEISRARAATTLSSGVRKGFRKPARGSISQRYGCTSYSKGKRHRSCRYFHDGVDIATPRGARVRASADGYVAYVGRNPWDSGKRAYVVIIGHARGYETVYGHLKPVRKVKAGQRVRRGQVIGIVGMTGHTTGPHVHWEVSRSFKTTNPLRAR